MADQPDQPPSNGASNPMDPSDRLSIAPDTNVQQTTGFHEDSAVTQAEKLESDGESAAKRIKLEHVPSERVKGVAPIKAEYRLTISRPEKVDDRDRDRDDAAEGAAHQPERNGKKNKGQNTARKFGSSRDEVGLCSSRANSSEFSPDECKFGAKCRFEHDLRKYLKDWKRPDLTTFEGVCPLDHANGKCDAGWKCRFVGSHMKEVEHDDGRKELVLVASGDANGHSIGLMQKHTTNNYTSEQKMNLQKKRFKTPKADEYTAWDDKQSQSRDAAEDNRAKYVEPPFLPSEKRRIYFGRETPVLAPLTTQGNLPFRRLCVGLGAQATYSEMAMSLPLIQGSKSECALMRAHVSETLPPTFDPKNQVDVVKGYDNSKDFKFGAQISANKPWQAVKATEVITSVCPHLRVVDLNSGCPIDLVFRTGAGSALMNSPGKLEKILRGMNHVSGEVPVSVKIRMGTADNRPTAMKLVERLVLGGDGAIESGAGPCGVAAITLHGRSRQQRYSRSADWRYIAECATLIKDLQVADDEVKDTARESDDRQKADKVYFLGNGDCYSHVDYFNHLDNASVDSVMIGRGALIKPWIFEEIEKGQYLDKSASERLQYIEQYVKNGLEVWGSDEHGVGLVRKFLLEWLSFAHRYVPIGLLEYLPPHMQDRPPAWRGRNDLETLMGSENYKDWIKIR